VALHTGDSILGMGSNTKKPGRGLEPRMIDRVGIHNILLSNSPGYLGPT